MEVSRREGHVAAERASPSVGDDAAQASGNGAGTAIPQRHNGGSSIDSYFDLLRSMSSPPVFHIAVTGGPCAGKTTALAVLEERLRLRGFRVFIVPEVATMFITGGAMFKDMVDNATIKVFQATILRAQIQLEDSYSALARMTKSPSVVISDRGAMDSAAYMSRALFDEMLEEHDWDVINLRDQRYTGVVHLVTAADGASEYYTLANNQARHEGAEEAVAIDRRLQDAWMGHSRLMIIDNRTDFMEKMDRTFNTVCKLLGLPESPQVVRKFVLRGDLARMLAQVSWLQEFQVEQTILTSRNPQDAEESVRRRGSKGRYSYLHRLRKRAVEGGESVELKRNITEREYIALLAYADPKRRTLRITRWVFMYDEQYYVCDTYIDVEPPLSILRSRTEARDSELSMPPFVQIDREVTDDPSYSVYSLSGRVAPVRRFEYDYKHSTKEGNHSYSSSF